MISKLVFFEILVLLAGMLCAHHLFTTPEKPEKVT